MNNEPAQFWPLVIVAGVLTSFILVGLFNKSRSASEYGFGGRYIGRIGGGAAIAAVILPTLGMGSAGWICVAASVVGIALYMVSATLSKRPLHPAAPLAAADAASLEG